MIPVLMFCAVLAYLIASATNRVAVESKSGNLFWLGMVSAALGCWAVMSFVRLLLGWVIVSLR
jgi:hypothetical protein